MQIFVKGSKIQKDRNTYAVRAPINDRFCEVFSRNTPPVWYLYSLWYWIYTVAALLLKVPALVPASFLGGLVILRDKGCFFSALQAHYLKVVRVLANNVFLTSSGDFVISGHCCRFVRGWLSGAGWGWCLLVRYSTVHVQVEFSYQNKIVRLVGWSKKGNTDEVFRVFNVNPFCIPYQLY